MVGHHYLHGMVEGVIPVDVTFVVVVKVFFSFPEVVFGRLVYLAADIAAQYGVINAGVMFFFQGSLYFFKAYFIFIKIEMPDEPPGMLVQGGAAAAPAVFVGGCKAGKAGGFVAAQPPA
jgi:hypothetical protein